MLDLLWCGFVVGRPWPRYRHAEPAMNLPPNGSAGIPAGPPRPGCPGEPGGGPRPSKVCGACGDRAKSYHFGGISCDSCKAFFRRSVQNEAYRHFQCPYEGRCEITVSSRKCCQYCRFHKCLSIGMETGWVMTEGERLQLVRNRMERKQRQGAPDPAHQPDPGKRPHRTPEHEPDPGELSKFLTPEEIATVESLVNAYEVSYHEVPFSEHLVRESSSGCSSPGAEKTCSRTRTEILDMFFTVVKQFTSFSQKLEPFRRMRPRDQEILLRTGVLELCFIRGAYAYDEALGRWPHTGKPLYRDSPTLEAEDVKKLVSPELFVKHMEFIRSVRELSPDEATTMLLVAIVLLSPDRPGLEREDLVAEEQEKFYILMKKYMSWRYGEEDTVIRYPKLLLRLPDLRELTDNHTDYNLRLGNEEVQEIQQKLSSLKIESGSPQRLDCGGPLAGPSREAPWNLRRDVLRAPSSPFSQEEESSSSESSDKILQYRM